MKKVTVYTNPSCMPCNMTKKWLKQHDVEYTELQVSDHTEYLKDHLGMSSAPVVVTSNDAWSGFRPDKLNTLL